MHHFSFLELGLISTEIETFEFSCDEVWKCEPSILLVYENLGNRGEADRAR
jgi:hypothetical protein